MSKTEITFDRLFQEVFDFLRIWGDHGLGKHKLSFHLCEVLSQQLPPGAERFLNQRLSIEVEQVEGIHTHLYLDLTLIGILHRISHSK